MIIDKTTDLIKLCDTLKKEPFFTLDTEFIREKTYYPKLCLIQVATPDVQAIIDPLAEMDMAPFWELLQHDSVLKVLHSSRQDVEIFYNITGKIPTPIHDTQITAMVFGFGESIGYGKLVEHYCRTKLDKSSRLTDWSKRPLTEKQIKYAIADVTYLVEIYKILKHGVEEMDRKQWVEEEMKAITEPSLYEPSPDTAWQKLKEKPRDSKKLPILKELAKWRELKAVELNRPRRYILPDRVLAEIAQLYPEQQKSINHIRGMKYNGEIFKVLKSLPTGVGENGREGEGLNPGKELVSLLSLLLRIQCQKNDVASRLVADKTDIAKIACGRTDTHTLKGWRYDLFGKYAQQLVRGEIGLKIVDSEVVIFAIRD